MSEQPSSRRQAALGRAYAGWLGFARNRLALVGPGLLVLALVAVALLADVLAPLSTFHR
jgi:peptide/nickel transport system permease protein